MNDNSMTILLNQYENENTNTVSDGVTLILDGKIKDVFDAIKEKHNCENYNEVMRDVIVAGVNYIISEK